MKNIIQQIKKTGVIFCLLYFALITFLIVNIIVGNNKSSIFFLVTTFMIIFFDFLNRKAKEEKLPTNLVNKFIKNSLICVYLVPLIVLLLPFLLKFIIDRSFLINVNIPFIQLGLVIIWFIIGGIISRQHVRYFFGFVIYFIIYWCVISFNTLIQYPPSQ